ncbi:MAG: ribosome small subunit-dependent GTPase A [Nitrosomonas sp.]|uniref:ribosome small subunit-dependent GTPase A n=1 Tax=Nitrosomonas sp. TaxID=42353 RepID=UPI0025CF3957|nr:ribosome small subunit-dependent GTPase A [Nitrosomonas sp.]UJP03885.1 MAG: ribosome small subunit-dependent GTPase A [Nitrosomonas sp.]
MSARSGKNKPQTKCLTGQVVAAFGRHYSVETVTGETISCVMRGKKGGIACGDQVEYQLTTVGQGVIETVKQRTSLLYRSDTFKEKIIAANVTQIIIVVAATPSFSEELINRCLVAAESENIAVLIVLNKADLIEPTQTAMETLSLYQDLGYAVLQLSATQDISALRPYLSDHLSVLAGQSGMGKSTLLNALIPEAKRATAEISLALDSGTHTTTHSQLYRLDDDSAIIDSPGFQEFGLNHIKEENLAWGFMEFHPYIGRCKFNNCHHTREPGCAVMLAVQQGKIHPKRLAFYQKLLRRDEFSANI